MEEVSQSRPLVRILRFWKYPDILRQTPGGRGVWRDIEFILDEPGEADYVLIHGHAPRLVSARCPRENVWLVLGEPPNEMYQRWNKLPGWAARCYTTDAGSISNRHHLSFAALPWHVDRDYDFLTRCPPPPKSRQLSWISSDRAETAGHQKRLDYLSRIRSFGDLELFGRGFKPIADKWDGLAPYRYSIAFENFSNAHYWTEKLTDCFLAWTMPVYFGCTELEKFFPRESFIRLDPGSADPVRELREIIASDRREKNLDAIQQARQLVLGKYNFFEFIAGEIEKDQAARGGEYSRPEEIAIDDHTLTPWQRVKGSVRRRLPVVLQRAYAAGRQRRKKVGSR
ncbi:MAG: glycosyltransferase family 10 [Planctomycetota bacterium]|nr:glycosyltransferase family 10 [Planctomycetota bacterium]